MQNRSQRASRSAAGPHSPIESRPKICGGKPCVRGTRIRVQDIALWHERLGLSADEIVSRFPQLTLPAVYAALGYYHEHRDEIQLQLSAADALANQLRPVHPSRLRRHFPRTE